VATKTPYITLAVAAALFAVMVAVEDAAADDDGGGSEYGLVMPSSPASHAAAATGSRAADARQPTQARATT
jgi:hypothetical protein